MGNGWRRRKSILPSKRFNEIQLRAMTRPSPWGENWHNENYSSAEMEGLLNQVFAPKCIFMGFSPAGKRKWVKTRQGGTMEVIYLHSDRRSEEHTSELQ